MLESILHRMKKPLQTWVGILQINRNRFIIMEIIDEIDLLEKTVNDELELLGKVKLREIVLKNKTYFMPKIIVFQ